MASRAVYLEPPSAAAEPSLVLELEERKESCRRSRHCRNRIDNWKNRP